MSPGYRACPGPRCLTEIPEDRDLCAFCRRTKYGPPWPEPVESVAVEPVTVVPEPYQGDGRSHRRGARAGVSGQTRGAA